VRASNVLESPRNGQDLSQVGISQANEPESREGAQLIVGIVQLFGNCQGIGEGRFDFRTRTFVVAQRRTQRRKELHGLPRAGGRKRSDAGKRALGAPATFIHQRQESPERHCGDRQCDAERRVAAG
jgi:hypothetical protein